MSRIQPLIVHVLLLEETTRRHEATKLSWMPFCKLLPFQKFERTYLYDVRDGVGVVCLTSFFTIFVKSLKMFCSVYPNYSVLKPNFSIFVRKSLHRIVGTHKRHLQFALIEDKSQTIFPVFYLRRPVKVSG